MKAMKRALEVLAGLGLWLALAGCVAAQVQERTSWKEEVQLHDGSRFIVERSVQLGGRREVGQRPPIREQMLSFRHPAGNHEITWTDAFAPDLGTANFLPMMLEVHRTGTYLVAHPMGCLSYNKWGRPNPPYVVFHHQGGEWRRIDLSELPAELKTPNLVFSSPDEQAERLGQSLISAQTIRSLYAGYRQPEFRSILREQIPDGTPNSTTSCEKLVRYKCGWGAPGEFNRKYFESACK